MFQLIFAYVAGLGPYVVVALALGFGIPFLLLVTKPSRWLVVFVVLFLGMVPFGGGDLAGASEGSLFRQIGWSSAFIIALFYALRSQDKFTVPWSWVPISYLVLLAYALLSVAWAEQPLVSAKRAVQLLGVLFIALALVRHSKGQNAFGLFAWPGLFFLLLGVVAIAAPSLSFDPDGNYKGFTFTKNVWGQFALLMALVFMFLALGKHKPRLNWWLFVFASASLFATHSATTITIYFAAISIVLFWVASKRYGSKMRIVSLATAIVGAVAMSGYFLLHGDLPFDAVLEASLGSVGKDVTLTGRTDLWRMMGYEIARHPWLGAGFGGFWLGLEGPSFTIVRFFAWRPGQAHNGYIDVVNELGYVGLALLLFVLAAHLRTIYWINRRGDGLTAVFHLAILVSALLLNASETNFMRTTHLWWIILTTSIISAHVYMRQPKETSEPPIAAAEP
jgi:O-antigen ligase